jgi:dolichol-phosphate mannosyltransferase
MVELHSLPGEAGASWERTPAGSNLIAAPDGPEPAERPDISVIVPVYREERSVRLFLQRVEPILEGIGSYEILFCYDPSPDRTKEVVLEEIIRNPRIRLLSFSRRFGQPVAIMAGLHHCIGKSCVILDVDLQDPPELIAKMYAKMQEGHDVVLARRRKRNEGEPLVRKLMSFVGYRVINALSDVEIPKDTGEFRILNRRVIDELCKLKEGHGFLRGLVAFVGFDQAFVEFDREDRAAGDSNYPRYFGSIRIGLNGIIGFSTVLLTGTLFVGLLIAVGAVLVGAYVAVMKLGFGEDYPLGFPTITLLIALLGGMQLVAIGILGEYIGRIYDEVKQRPAYIVDRFFNPPALGRREQGSPDGAASARGATPRQ